MTHRECHENHRHNRKFLRERQVEIVKSEKWKIVAEKRLSLFNTDIISQTIFQDN